MAPLPVCCCSPSTKLSNYNDTVALTDITICGGGTTICEKYTGNHTGAEPPTIGSGPDGTNCIYTNSDITNLKSPERFECATIFGVFTTESAEAQRRRKTACVPAGSA
jgi:hypothetical protein